MYSVNGISYIFWKILENMGQGKTLTGLKFVFNNGSLFLWWRGITSASLSSSGISYFQLTNLQELSAVVQYKIYIFFYYFCWNTISSRSLLYVYFIPNFFDIIIRYWFKIRIMLSFTEISFILEWFEGSYTTSAPIFNVCYCGEEIIKNIWNFIWTIYNFVIFT